MTIYRTAWVATTLVGLTNAFVLQPHAWTTSSRFGPLASTASTMMTTTSTDVSTDLNTALGLTVPPISPFGQGTTPTSSDKHLLGGKGANLAQMSAIGLAVPPGFTLTTECCAQFCDTLAWNQKLPAAVWQQVVTHVQDVERAMKCEFGSPTNPLLLSVRSGAAIRYVRVVYENVVMYMLLSWIHDSFRHFGHVVSCIFSCCDLAVVVVVVVVQHARHGTCGVIVVSVVVELPETTFSMRTHARTHSLCIFCSGHSTYLPTFQRWTRYSIWA